jgi:hypothetical protein
VMAGEDGPGQVLEMFPTGLVVIPLSLGLGRIVTPFGDLSVNPRRIHSDGRRPAVRHSRGVRRRAHNKGQIGTLAQSLHGETHAPRKPYLRN